MGNPSKRPAGHPLAAQIRFRARGAVALQQLCPRGYRWGGRLLYFDVYRFPRIWAAAQGVAVALALAALVATVVPLHQQPSDSLTSAFLYKGRREDEISHRAGRYGMKPFRPYRSTLVGSGFGTSPTSMEVASHRKVSNRSVRPPESMATATWRLRNGWDLREMFRFSPSSFPRCERGAGPSANAADQKCFIIRSPIGGILMAGLVHAAFEDWLFAPGYYLCVFFWSLAFIMMDVLPGSELSPQSDAPSAPRAWSHGLGTAALGR